MCIRDSTEGITDTSVSGAVAKVSNQRIAVDGIYVNMKAYQIDGNNYVKLRDIGKQVDFGVGYDNATASVRIDTDAPYTESTTSANGSAITKWNKTMAEFNPVSYTHLFCEHFVNNEENHPDTPPL